MSIKKVLDYVQHIFQVGKLVEQNFSAAESNKIQTIMYFVSITLVDMRIGLLNSGLLRKSLLDSYEDNFCLRIYI